MTRDDERAASRLLKEVKGFLDSSVKNSWVNTPHVSVYMRKSVRYIEGKMCSALDIASIEISEEKRGRGLFKKFLSEVEKLNPYSYVLVESVINEKFLEFFQKSPEWKNYNGLSDTFYKKALQN